jgi:hypothetical protein
VRRRGSIIAGIVSTATLITVIAAAPEHAREAARVYLPLMAAIAIHGLVSSVLDASPLPGGRRDRRRRPAPSDTLKDLRYIEAAVAISPSSASETHHRLRPVLREIAADRLEMGRRIVLDEDLVRAQAVLGDEAWALLRPDAPRPADASTPGPSRSRLKEILSRVEAI